MKELMFLWLFLSLAACVLLYSAVTVANHGKEKVEPHYTKFFCENTFGKWENDKFCVYDNGVICNERVCVLSDKYFETAQEGI